MNTSSPPEKVRCPLCGAELNGEQEESDLLCEMIELEEKGILEQTMFVAVKVVQSMGDNNPAWMKEALDEQTGKIKDSINALDRRAGKIKDSIQKRLMEETRVVLESVMEIKGNPVILGRIQEESIAKRLSSLKTGQDRFKIEKSRKAQEDVECLVIEEGKELGKIVIESKRTKKWLEDYVEQLKTYMEKENTEFGILATRTMPDDALNSTIWRDGILVVQIEHIEPAYIFLREHLKLLRDMQRQFSERTAQMGARDQILEEIKQAIASRELDNIIDRINATTLRIDDTLDKAENYVSRIFKNIRKDTSKIRKYTEELIGKHIEKIRTQLVQQPPPLFLDSFDIVKNV